MLANPLEPTANPESMKAGATESERDVHLEFIHDFKNLEASVRTDLRDRGNRRNARCSGSAQFGPMTA